MTQEQFFERFIALLLAKSLRNQHFNQIMHDLQKADHPFFRKFLTEREVTIQVSELLYDRQHNASIQVFYRVTYLGFLKPLVAYLSTF